MLAFPGPERLKEMILCQYWSVETMGTFIAGYVKQIFWPIWIFSRNVLIHFRFIFHYSLHFFVEKHTCRRKLWFFYLYQPTLSHVRMAPGLYKKKVLQLGKKKKSEGG